ncbi:MAG: hypothetical protein Tsb0021_14910 [Chlamydiales bacterium]
MLNFDYANCNLLVSDKSTWKLDYQNYSKNTDILHSSAVLTISFITYPILVLLGVILPLHQRYQSHCEEKAKERLINVLNDENRLNEYLETKQNKSEARIEITKKKIIRLISQARKQGIECSEELPLDAEGWRGFDWKQLTQRDSLPFSMDLASSSAKSLDIAYNLLTHIAKLDRLEQQHQILSSDKEDEKGELAKKLAAMSFVKHSIKQKNCNTLSRVFKVLLIPTGPLWIHFSTVDDRKIFDNIRGDLTSVSELEMFSGCKDLIEAHNSLIEKNLNTPFVPYFATKIVT